MKRKRLPIGESAAGVEQEQQRRIEQKFAAYTAISSRSPDFSIYSLSLFRHSGHSYSELAVGVFGKNVSAFPSW